MVDPVWQKKLSPVRTWTVCQGRTCFKSRYTIF